MRISMVTDSLAHLGFEELLDTAAGLGITQLEFPTGGWSSAPHLDLDRLLADAGARNAFSDALERRGITISALNANGNQLHPVIGPQVDRVLHRTVDLASLLGIGTVVCMSGLPAGAPGDRTPNWVTTSWPPETQEILNHQWNEVAIPYWKDLAGYGRDKGVRFAVEMHGDQLVYNAATLLRLREAVGETVGANLDPSHPMWMGADPLAMIRALRGAVFNVHAKDSRRQPQVADVNGMLDTQPPERSYDRSWNYVTLGLGHPGGQQFWGRFCADLRAGGYDGPLAIEHEDIAMDAVEGVAQTVRLLSEVLLVGPPSWKPQAI